MSPLNLVKRWLLRWNSALALYDAANWQDPRRLAVPRRFDIAAKHFYGRMRKLDIPSMWAKEVYLSHISVWNDFFEDTPPKTSDRAFLKAFDHILDATSRSQPGLVSVLPVASRGTLLNGAHRAAAALVHGKKVMTIEIDVHRDHCIYGYEFFENMAAHKALKDARDILDAIALEYFNILPRLAVVVQFPAAGEKTAEITQQLSRHFPIYYAKSLELTHEGAVNFVAELYQDDAWVGNAGNNFAGARSKAGECFKGGSGVRAYLISYQSSDELVSAKELIRQMLGGGKDPIHISDPGTDSLRAARIVFNNNTIHFLNSKRTLETPRLDELLARYQDVMGENNTEEYCIDGGGCLAAWGLRDCSDIDYIHIKNALPASDDLSSHNDYARYYDVPKEEVILDGRKHFFYRGVKFAALDQVKQWKHARDEEKDRSDLKLIELVS